MNQSTFCHIGLDLGSTTVKLVVISGSGAVAYARYQRHMSNVRATVAQMLRDLLDSGAAAGMRCSIALTGSGAIALAQQMHLPFVQEVIASSESIRRFHPEADVAIELGGEDAKITFLTGGAEQRMNETCAGGTGAFIDQMAAFLHTDAAGLNALAEKSSSVYPIASRCGVFAKTDILPLLNEGCAREDIAASIFQAVVDQTVNRLACGRKIAGNVIFLDAPLAFLPALRRRFALTLRLSEQQALFPENAQYFVAIGAALHSSASSSARTAFLSESELRSLAADIEAAPSLSGSAVLPPLFRSAAELEEFRSRHARNAAQRAALSELGSSGQPEPVYLGIDAGSTTIKSVLLDRQGRIVHSTYASSQGKPLNAAIDILKEIYGLLPPNVRIAASGVTGYGGPLLKAALHADVDEVETLAHFKAARFFLPEASFVLDIGGQDIKCMHIKNGAIGKIQLNEACSSGCGSFLETFAKSLGISLSDFVGAALMAEHPVDLGTRCTVFMNSRVKQAQKEGHGIPDIAAGLCYSVIRNALYKVIKISDVAELGEYVVAQGGSFRNDALLRALELILKRPVLRLDISGLMGAFGAAMIARERACSVLSSILSREEAERFTFSNASARCGRCSNRCLLTVSTFPDGKRFVSGNRCERGSGMPGASSGVPNLADYKCRRAFDGYVPL